MDIVEQGWSRAAVSRGRSDATFTGRARSQWRRPRRIRIVALAVSLAAPALVVAQASPAMAATSLVVEPLVSANVVAGQIRAGGVNIVNTSSDDATGTIAVARSP